MVRQTPGGKDREKAHMKITVDEKSGFCTGVVRAVSRAEKELAEGEKLYSLGNIVHNTEEVNRLAGMGLQSLTHDEFGKLRNATVLIRAHGEPPATFEIARKNNIKLIDATCPVVSRLQNRIRDTYAALKQSGGMVLIFGKKDHPEVRALVGQTGGGAVVVREAGELAGMDLNRPVALYSQTTMKTGDFEHFLARLRAEMKAQGADPRSMLEVHNSICGQVSSREPWLRKFAAEHDAVLFVSGKESSNGKALFRVCKEINPSSYFISRPEEIDGINLAGTESIGISGATSTPGWLIRDVEAYLKSSLG
jgi:4-hydroxy-3-methylbut-2-enyl diphosphate reductase